MISVGEDFLFIILFVNQKKIHLKVKELKWSVSERAQSSPVYDK